MKALLKKKLLIYIFAFVFVAVFATSLSLFFVKQKSKSYVFIFPSAENGSYIVERRNLSNDPAQGVIQLYVDELLLGSTVERTKLIFSSNTRVNSCFLRGNILYLDLSDDLLSIEKSSFPINEGIELLRENILKNFSNINKIELFIGGKFVASMEK
ncbi:MAG: GerMN domain-containing protein [Treponema sp.]|nr:GerMN domain-containing protein [Treponema sp.]